MEFHGFETYHDVVRRNGSSESPRKYYDRANDIIKTMPGVDGPSYASVVLMNFTERDWLLDGRPYYSVWPSIVPSLLKLKLDIDSKHCQLPMASLLLRFAKSHELECGDARVKSILASKQLFNGQPAIGISVQITERVAGPQNNFIPLIIRPGETMEQYLDGACTRFPETTTKRVEIECILRVVATICLIGNDPDIITPDVLAADRANFDRTGDSKYVEKAVRRGKRGWIVGSRLEIDPHYRRPHLAIRWCEQGHSVPRIVPVKGAIVKRSKYTEIPTGFLGQVSE